MFRKALLAALMIIVGGGLTVTAVSGTAAASPSACPVSAVIEITSFAFSPPTVVPGQSSTATLTAVNCTDLSQQTSETWSGQWSAPSTSAAPTGCPAIDPFALPVTFPPDGSVSTSETYSVPSSCTATQLIVTVDIRGIDGALLAHGTAVLQIIRPSLLAAAANPAWPDCQT
jgi:hypothetical protein